MNGKRPVFIDESANVFFFPYLHLRFIEMPAGSVTGSDPEMAADLGKAPAPWLGEARRVCA